MANENIKFEIPDGDIDGANQKFVVSQPYSGLCLFYNGVCYPPGSARFGYQVVAGSTEVETDSPPDQGDAVIVLRDE